jgi:2-oxoglutarate/2-oxoacid ferredoxin oxidoreductase subunit alpha
MLADAGIRSDYMRVRAIPFSNEVIEFIRKHTHNYVVELNRDGQLNQLLTLAIPEESTRLISTAHSDGMPLSARWVYQRILTLKEAKS